jgi:hypothetical protein
LQESYVWRAILWTFVITGLVGLAATLDPGFLTVFNALNVVPVSTGERIEMLVTKGSMLSRTITTDLYFLEKDASFRKVTTFEDMWQCVTDFNGQLFVTFQDKDGTGGGASSIFKDGKWVRSVSAPTGFEITDAASYEGMVYALAVTGDGKKLAAQVLGEQGWQPAGEPFDAGKEIKFGGSAGVEGGVLVMYAAGPTNSLGMIDLAKTHWYLVTFDGAKWGAEQPLDVPAGAMPNLCVYQGAPGVILLPSEEDQPAKLALVKDGKLDVASEIPTKGRGKVVAAWLVELAGQNQVFLVGPGRVWALPFADMKAGEARQLLAVEEGSMLRSRLYVGLLGVGAVLMVSLGAAWLVMRIRRLGRKRDDKE